MCACAQAQNDVNVTHTYVYHASYNESREQAERNAVNCAKNEALRERFGTIVSGASASSLITKNNITKSSKKHIRSWISILSTNSITIS